MLRVQWATLIFLIALFPSAGGGLAESPTARNFLTRPPTGTPRRAISPSEGLPILYALCKGVAKAALYCAYRATTVSSWGLCEQKGHLAVPSFHHSLSFISPSQQGGLFGLPLRASNEGLLRPRVARAQETNRLLCPALDCPFPWPI